jgi:hypothetical protein
VSRLTRLGCAQVPFIGRVPLDPNLTTCGEAGVSFFDKYPLSPSLQVLQSFIATLPQD